MSKKQKPKKKRLRNYARFSSLTIQMGLIIAAGAYSGKYLDSQVNNQTPAYTIIFSLLAIFVALYISLKGMSNK
ncbi:MAG TPA: AtpZ/AtpI family protein [Flavobacteriales bacterium]|jgi:membrane protein YdbS with pleckstrin-like domain|nr:AtpZ/AtpI family protein [Flavobacteriales bacterium]HJN64321.1 AtpZ/AtpI family protein [Flavobacteriales bacterium]